MSYLYLASPFSHKRWWVRLWRFLQACRYAARLMLRGETVFAPIPHSFAVELFFPRAEGFEFWMAQDLPILAKASRLVVLKLDGWDKSKGVAREMEYAKQVGIPIEFMEAE